MDIVSTITVKGIELQPYLHMAALQMVLESQCGAKELVQDIYYFVLLFKYKYFELLFR